MNRKRGRVAEAVEERGGRLRRILSPPIPVYPNPFEKAIEKEYPLGRWNLYIGGAGNQVPGYVNVDLFGIEGVDVVCDAERLPFPDNLFTRIECDAVLEHTPNPDRIVSDIFRCLHPGGIAHFVVPFCHPYHLYPADYWRFSPEGLRRLTRQFELIDRGWRSGPTATWIVFTLEWAKSWFAGQWSRRACHFVLGWILFPLRYLDALLLTRPNADQIGNHHYLYVRKPLAGTEPSGTGH